MGMSKCKRKYFYSEYTKDKWFLNYDPNGKHYFYNAENQSVWELPVLFYKSEDEKKGGLGNSEEKEKGFRRNFDDDLPTFNNLYNRLSMRQTPKEGNTTASEETVSGGGATASIFPKLPVDGEVKASSLTTVSSNKASSVSVRYSNKAPSDLSSNFKCIVLEKNGKKCK